MAKNDGEVLCKVDGTLLNRTDLVCWRCGSKSLDRSKVEDERGGGGEDLSYEKFAGLLPEDLDRIFVDDGGQVLEPTHYFKKYGVPPKRLHKLTSEFYCECKGKTASGGPACGVRAKKDAFGLWRWRVAI